MKKLIIAFSAAVVGFAVNAAVCNWEATGLASYAGSAAGITGSQVYSFDTSMLTQQALLSAFGTDGWSAALAKGFQVGDANYDGGDAAGTISGYANSQAVDAYLAIVDGTNLFISEVDGMSQSIGVSGQDAAVNFDVSSDIGEKYGKVSTFAGGGWYQAVDVPEPTSGLLLLIGMAGLALRRRRA